MPVSARKARAKWRGERRARAASVSTPRSSAGCSVIHCWTSRSGSRRAVWAASWALNWAWLPGLRRKTTRWRAMVSAVSRPRSSSTRARARSMPEVTPAEVDDLSVPDVDRVGVDLDGRVVAGELVAVRPVRGHAAAVQQARLGEQDRAGAHRDQALGARGPCARSQSVRRGSGRRVPWPPGTSRVCGGAGAGEGLVRYEGQAAGGAHGRAVQGGRADAVGARGVLLGARRRPPAGR